MNKIVTSVLSTVVGVAVVGGTVAASNTAKPGDTLFPVKKAVERMQVALSTSDQARADIQAKIATERVQDLGEVSDQHKSEAKTEAQDQLSNAIATLKEVEAKLLAKGNTQAAQSVAENITKLEQMAAQNQLDVKVEDQNGTGDQSKTEDQNDNGSDEQTEVKNGTSVKGQKPDSHDAAGGTQLEGTGEGNDTNSQPENEIGN